MSGKDDDSRSDLAKWLDSQRAEAEKIRKEFQDGFDKELRNWNDNAPSSIKGPFERFKDFVDTNFSTFAQGFKNFPSNVSELKARMQQEREARRLEELDISRRWVGCDDSPDHIRLQIERQSADEWQGVKDATYELLRESYRRNQHVPPEKILDLYRDNEWSFGSLDQFATPMLSMGGACYYKTETVDNLPSTARWCWPAAKPQWLSIDWFKRSPYSPIRLEAHPDLQGSDTAIDPSWRAAFEDLLSAALDKPMVSEEKIGQRIPYGTPQSTYHGPGLDWMLSLQCRGILPPQLPSLYKPIRLFDGFDEAKRPRAAEFMHDIDSIISNKSTRMYPLVKRDLNLLMDEVAVKSTPPAMPLWIPQSPWRIPETEHELYEQMLPYPDLLRPEPLTVPTMTGKRYIDRQNAEEVLLDALMDNDVTTATKCLDAYDEAHGDLDDLFPVSTSREEVDGRFLPSWYPLLAEALEEHVQRKERKVYEEELAKQALEKDQKGSLKCDRRSNERSRQAREEEVRSFDTVSEEEYDNFPLKDKIERRPVEAEKAASLIDQQPAKRPGILSQLTTTQTTRLPDGTVTVKVVLKQRFADGREELHESVQTSRDEPSHTNQPETKRVEEQPKKKGWFWN